MAARLRCGDHRLVVRCRSLLAHGEDGVFEIDVRPAEAGEFTASHAGVESDGPQRDEAIVAQSAEEVRCLLG